MSRIGVFDSGMGGLTVLEELQKVLPNENFIYYGDHENCPYGTKTKEELFLITSRIVDFFERLGCSVIVIACNTATTLCMKDLRKKYPHLIFVGTVPAIKVAYDKGYHRTLIMVTPATIASERTKELLQDYHRPDQELYLVACDGLAQAIEQKDDILIEKLLVRDLSKYRMMEIDSVVLGCTHYPWIKDKILKVLPGVAFLDGANGVAREVKRQLEMHHLENEGEPVYPPVILDSLDFRR